MRDTVFLAARGRTATIRLTPDGCCVVRVPRWMSRARAEAWVVERLPKLEQRLARIPHHLICLPTKLEVGQQFRVLEASYTLASSSARKFRLFVTQLLDTEIRPIAERHSRLLECELPSIKYRAYRSRLGACMSSRQELTFHWGLGFLPRAHVAAVVAHEMAHLKYGSHGPRFWQTVARLEPDYQRPHDEARLLGPYLRLPNCHPV